MKAFISAILACATLTACATSYVGPHPDFTKTGFDAKAEFEKFELGTRYGDFNMRSIKMGKQAYYRETVEPILAEVSPAAVVKLDKMKAWHYVGWGFFVATMAAIFQPRGSWAYETGYWIGLGGLLGTGIYVNVTGMNAAEDYNIDLKSKFSPSLVYSKTF